MEALAATIGHYDCRHYEIPSIMAVITTRSSELKPSLHIAMHSSTPRQNGGLFADDVFRWIFMNEKFCILIKISLKFVPKGSIDNIPALWQWPGANQATSHYLDHWVMIFLLTHICVTRPQQVNIYTAPSLHAVPPVKIPSSLHWRHVNIKPQASRRFVSAAFSD